MDNLSNMTLEEILEKLPATIYKTKGKHTSMYFLRIGVLIGGGWYAYYKSAYSRKSFSYGDVSADNLKDCLIKCLNEINLLKEKADQNIRYSYEDIKYKHK